MFVCVEESEKSQFSLALWVEELGRRETIRGGVALWVGPVGRNTIRGGVEFPVGQNRKNTDTPKIPVILGNVQPGQPLNQ